MELGCTIITVDIYSKVFAMNEGADRDQICATMTIESESQVYGMY